MRRSLVGHRRVARIRAFRLALGEHGDQPCQPVDLTGLPRHHIRQILDRADQMRHAFLKLFGLVQRTTRRLPP